MEAYARKADACAREAIRLNPGKKDCQWLLQKTEGSAAWDWNITNHSRTIAFYRQLIEDDTGEPKKALPYLYLIDNLIADHRAEEAEAYLERYKKLPGCKAFIVPTYEAAIALARFDEARADAIMEKALVDFPGNSGMLFEAAQYYARKCDYDRAIACYEASFEKTTRRPRFQDELMAIAHIWEIRRDYKKAAETYERIVALLEQEWGLTDEVELQVAKEELARLRSKAK
jgi:tetratricopeptide (TPR) repeat protein